MHYDIFNGDADGIISLLQLRLSKPHNSQLITGVKRDIQLLDGLQVNELDSVTVLDISMHKNLPALNRILETGAKVFYVDHHLAGDIPSHANLDAHIDLDTNMCTALIIDQLLEGKYRQWAISAAYGDNLFAVADSMCVEAGLNVEQANQLKELGTLINYNGYGKSLEQLHFHPAELYKQLLRYPSPFDAISDTSSPYHALKQAYGDDIEAAINLPAMYESETVKVFLLPDEDFSHRVSGVYGNLLANQSPSLAHIVLTQVDSETYTVSLRAPLENKQGAGNLCGQFETGGGREAAGGINKLPRTQLDRLISVVESGYSVK